VLAIARIVAALTLLAASAAGAAEVRNHEASGNLESTHDLGCVGSTRLSPTHTPPDLYRALEQCVQRDAYEEATFLFALAGVYGRFDTLRVADRSAHQAVTVLVMQTFGAVGESKTAAFRKRLQESLGSPAGLASTCAEIRRIGPPGYHPRYMIQHGMGAFVKSGSSDGLVPGFDAASAWKSSLDGYLHCPGI
jgi:hypothetical protein